jgi:Family of unknown function (DUF5681)
MSENSIPPSGDSDNPRSVAAPPSPAKEDNVGPGRPPRDTRWKKGGPSPNPRGRPRKDQSMLPDLKKIFEQALKKKVTVSRGGREVSMTRLDIGVEQLLNQVASGDRHARREVMEIAAKYGIDIWGEHQQAIEAALAPNHQAILDSYVARHSGTDELPAPRVLAPAQLLDDDAAKAAETTASPPTAATEPEPFEKAKAEVELKQRPAAQKLDQASFGYGHPPPGGYSVTTKQWT